MSSIIVSDKIRQNNSDLKNDLVILNMLQGIPSEHRASFFNPSNMMDSCKQANNMYAKHGSLTPLTIGSVYNALKALSDEGV